MKIIMNDYNDSKNEEITPPFPKKQFHMNYETIGSAFSSGWGDKGQSEWGTFRAVHEEKRDSYVVETPRSKDEPRYANVVHIHRMRVA